MKRKNLKAEDLAREICRQEKIGYETVHFLAEALLCRYAKGSGLALKGPNNMSKEMIAKEKQRIRRRYIEIIGGIRHFTNEEYENFIWDVVRCRWFMDKADMILDSIEEMVDGKVTTTPYNPRQEGENKLQGKQLKTILRLAFLNGENQIMSKQEICSEMEISEATFNRRYPVAVVLFGILMWIYANRREQEDINAGIVDRPPYYKEKVGVC